MTVEIRPVPAAGMRPWFESIMTAFGEELTEEQWKLDQLTLEPDRALGGYDGDQVVGGGAAFSLKMTVPGGAIVPVGGVTMVGVMPTHRRQGVLRSLMARQLTDVRERGEPMAALWASEGSIYQRFGYGLATTNGSIEIERDRATFRRAIAANGVVELRDADAARSALVKVYDVVRARTPGFYERKPAWWNVVLSDAEFRRRGAGKRFNAVLTRDGEDVGYVLYRIKSEWLNTGPANTLIVLELLGVDADAIGQLWRYVFGVDLMSMIRSRLGPPDHPLLLMVAEPRRLQLRVGDALWVRIVDVPKALEARGYSADGSIVLEVSDEFMPDVAGRWRLTVSDGNARAENTTDPADMQLEIQDLGAVYLGGFTFASLGQAGRTVECSPGARDRADALFATTVVPWCPEVF
jgi:predicted acetyltransferase